MLTSLALSPFNSVGLVVSYNFNSSVRRGYMATKSRLRLEQEVAMDVYYVRMTAAHARLARKKGRGNLSEGVRIMIETDIGGMVERRHGPPDRRKKRK